MLSQGDVLAEPALQGWGQPVEQALSTTAPPRIAPGHPRLGVSVGGWVASLNATRVPAVLMPGQNCARVQIWTWVVPRGPDVQTPSWHLPLVLINGDRWGGGAPCPGNGVCVVGTPDCCQHPLKAHKNKLSIGLPVGKIDSVHPTVAGT